MKRTFFILAVMTTMSLAVCNKVDAQSKTGVNVTYAFQCVEEWNGKITITGYNGRLAELEIPEKINGMPVTYIGSRAFEERGITKVTIPNSVTAIWSAAFADNRLTSITIPDSVTSIDFRAFADNRLTSITIPNSVTSIGARAFQGNSLTSITIGANVNIGDTAFGIPREGYSNENSFAQFYNTGGKLAGTYTRPAVNSTTWTKQ